VAFFRYNLNTFTKEIKMSSTTVTRGNSHETFYIGPSLTPAAVAAYTSAVQTFTIPGLQTTDIVLVIGATSAQTAGILPGEADCYTANVLSLQFLNATAASATPAAGTYVIQIVRAEGPLPVTAV
jgi:hypothetical protein